MKIFVKKCFAVAFTLVYVIFTAWLTYAICHPAEKVSHFKLPEFQGRIFGSELIRPGAFMIERPYEDVGNWGKDAILLYQKSPESVVIDIWRPDPVTLGAFEHAKTFFYPHRTSFQRISEVRMGEDRVITATLGRDNFLIVLLYVLVGFILVIARILAEEVGWAKRTWLSG